ncbi:MAG: hypothetical protein HFE51_02135 [Clostridia bacterium]|jgi:hypothetical protein|nr:hypothetical protein [Clostridia bacterium]MCI8979125.1 hypothetical protein [Clostridia bacterium]MCI9085203.1 hypothetical protein [Clostridia bacterium]NDO19871.1 hypothetical protein [Lachnospiraceae bacterium MD329]
MINLLITIVFLGILIILAILALIHSVIVSKTQEERYPYTTLENEEKSLGFFLPCLVLIFSLGFFIYFCADIPSARSGGEVIYVDELPDVIQTSHYSHIYSKKYPELNGLKNFNPYKYEKYGHYRIRYTKLTKHFLDIEKLD